MSAQNFLLIISVLLSFVTILKVALKPQTALHMNTYYYVYKINQIDHEYDFAEVLTKDRKYYPIATFVTLIFYSLSLKTNNSRLNDMFVYIVIGILAMSIIYLKPSKKTREDK